MTGRVVAVYCFSKYDSKYWQNYGIVLVLTGLFLELVTRSFRIDMAQHVWTARKIGLRLMKVSSSYHRKSKRYAECNFMDMPTRWKWYCKPWNPQWSALCCSWCSRIRQRKFPALDMTGQCILRFWRLLQCLQAQQVVQFLCFHLVRERSKALCSQNPSMLDPWIVS